MGRWPVVWLWKTGISGWTTRRLGAGLELEKVPMVAKPRFRHERVTAEFKTGVKVT
jgi:hypothetical protein